MIGCPEIDDYIRMIREGSSPDAEYPVCQDQIRLADMVEIAFAAENLRIDQDQLAKYLALQKYFPFDLFPWEKFVFALHNCVYREDGELRWPNLNILVGRGAGKNGYLAFEDFCLLTPINGVKRYNIDIFAMSEDQARTTFDDVWQILEDNKTKLSKHFRWTREEIENLKTRSKLKFRTANPRTKDGGRPGKVDFDEYHQYENYYLVDVAETGLGKKKYPRKTIITTQGDVRDGPLDTMLETAEEILAGKIIDNGTLPLICRIEDRKEADEERMWHKANPSLRYLPTLMNEMRGEYFDFTRDRIKHASFMVKRMNCTAVETEDAVASREDIRATDREIPDLEGLTCIAGIDYAETTDFVSAGLLFEVSDVWYWITHTWVSARNIDSISRIRAPLKEWEGKELLTMVDAPRINPDIPVAWLERQSMKYNIQGVYLDKFRYPLLAKAMKEAGFDDDAKNGTGNVHLTRPSNIMLTSPTISAKFAARQIVYGNNPLMRWFTNNAKKVRDGKDNVSYGKIEPKSRKTDGFMAFVHAATGISTVDGWNDGDFGGMDVYTF